MVTEFYLPDEVLAAGVEAKREAEMRCFTEAEVVSEIYLAMVGHAIKCAHHGEEVLH